MWYVIEDAPGLHWVGVIFSDSLLVSLETTSNWLALGASVGGVVGACSSSEISTPVKTLQLDT